MGVLFGTLPTHYGLLCVILNGILTQADVFCGDAPYDPDCDTFTTRRPTTTRSKSDDVTPNYSAFYTVAIFFGVVGLPLAIMFRVCWVRRLNARYNRQLNEASGHLHHGVNHNRPEVFTIEVEPGFLPSYEQSIADSPPPYDQIPPPYKLKKNESSASLPPYSAEDMSTSSTHTSHPAEIVQSPSDSSSRSTDPQDSSS